MCANVHCFVEWKEEFISQERGSRVVHYFLRDSNGNSTLAVVGTERSVRHMFYVVADEFFSICEADNSAHFAGFKWRSRREVVDWLTAMLSKHLTGDHSRLPVNDSVQALPSYKIPVNVSRDNISDYVGQFPRDLVGHDSDIMWSGVAWTCGKQLKHYPEFSRNGTAISIQSFVFVMAKDEDHYLAYLEDMYEDRKGQKKIKVRWFHYNQEVKGVLHIRNSHPNEVFITPYSQVISAECVDGPATVLTPDDYEKCLLAFPNASLERIHICFRQFRSNRVKAFDLSKLCGYFDQAILLCLDPKSNFHDSEDEDEFGKRLNAKPVCTRARRFGKMVAENASARLLGQRGHRIVRNPIYNRLKYGLCGKRLILVKHTGLQVHHVGQKIELLCQDSGIRGCWFRCTVLHVSKRQIKVQYDDVLDEDDCGNLKEWIMAYRLAMPDKLGMRCLNRQTIRPAPFSNEIQQHTYNIGSAVDAWWSDGWWEGAIIGIDDCKDDTLQVYFPGENLVLNIHRKNLRISRDWIGDKWVEVAAKPDILDATSSIIAKNEKCDGFYPLNRIVSNISETCAVKNEFAINIDLVRNSDDHNDGHNADECMQKN